MENFASKKLSSFLGFSPRGRPPVGRNLAGDRRSCVDGLCGAAFLFEQLGTLLDKMGAHLGREVAPEEELLPDKV